MDCTGREGTKEALEGEDSCRSNLKSAKADTRRAKTKGAPSRNFDRPSSASEKANSASLICARLLASQRRPTRAADLSVRLRHRSRHSSPGHRCPLSARSGSTASLEPDGINYATGASWICCGRCLDKVSELIAVSWLTDQTDGDLSDKPPRTVPFAR